MEDFILSSELRVVIRASSKATASFLGADSYSSQPSRSPAQRRLIEAILFSRGFIWSYYIVLACMLVAYASVRWVARFRRRRKSKQIGERPHGAVASPKSPEESIASSSGSTLQGTESPPAKHDGHGPSGERTPLLAQRELQQSTISGSMAYVRRHLQAFLMYQPRPIFALTASSNHLPSNQTSIAILLFFGLNLFYLFYNLTLTIPTLFAFADRAGLCFVVNLPILYILAVKNNRPLKALTGWSYEGLNIFHRRLGEWMIVLAVMHTVGMIGVWYTIFRPFNFSFARYLSLPIILLGLMAFISYVLIYITSTGFFRQLYYELFLGLHIVLQVAALVLLFFHHQGCRPYVIATFVIWILDRVMARMFVSCNKFVATLRVGKGDTILLFCDIKISRSPTRLFSISNGWQAGQHVFVTVPALGFKHRLQAHPFTIASAAPPKSLREGVWPLHLIVRGRNGFSKDLLDYGRFHQHTEIVIDGPYGSTEILESLHHADRTCLIAGGSGIAVTYPLTWSLQVKPEAEDAAVHTSPTYRDGKRYVPQIGDIGMPGNSERCTQMWIRQSDEHASWLTMFPRSDALMPDVNEQATLGHGSHKCTSLVNEIYTTAGGPYHERPDIKVELRRWAEYSPDKTRSMCIVVSGPDGLVRDVRNTASRLAKEGYRVEVHVEKFGW